MYFYVLLGLIRGSKALNVNQELLDHDYSLSLRRQSRDADTTIKETLENFATLVYKNSGKRDNNCYCYSIELVRVSSFQERHSKYSNLLKSFYPCFYV